MALPSNVQNLPISPGSGQICCQHTGWTGRQNVVVAHCRSSQRMWTESMKLEETTTSLKGTAMESARVINAIKSHNMFCAITYIELTMDF